MVAGGLLSFAVDQLRFGTNLFLVTALRHFGAIGRLETYFDTLFSLGSNDERINNINLLEGVAAVGVHFAVG